MASKNGEMRKTADTGELSEVFETLGDELSRRILVEAVSETVTASSLAKQFDVAPATVYRRLNGLCDLGFISEVTDIRQVSSSEAGYRTDVQTLVLALSSDGFDVVQADSGLRAALSLVLDRIDVTEATFKFDDGTVTVTMSMDDTTLHELHDSYHAVARRDGDGDVESDADQ
jgi:DNA-binding transcriptional ArsR family regulator